MSSGWESKNHGAGPLPRKPAIVKIHSKSQNKKLRATTQRVGEESKTASTAAGCGAFFSAYAGGAINRLLLSAFRFLGGIGFLDSRVQRALDTLSALRLSMRRGGHSVFRLLTPHDIVDHESLLTCEGHLQQRSKEHVAAESLVLQGSFGLCAPLTIALAQQIMALLLFALAHRYAKVVIPKLHHSVAYKRLQQPVTIEMHLVLVASWGWVHRHVVTHSVFHLLQ